MNFILRKDIGQRVRRARPQREQDGDELAYWLSRPPEERIEAGSFLTRRLYRLTHGVDLPPLDKGAGRRVRRAHG